jgi:hypothetical protein
MFRMAPIWSMDVVQFYRETPLTSDDDLSLQAGVSCALPRCIIADFSSDLDCHLPFRYGQCPKRTASPASLQALIKKLPVSPTTGTGGTIVSQHPTPEMGECFSPR